jgi:hypothetical protein
MPRKPKSLLKKHEVQIAKAKRTCKNSGETIGKGEVCLVVWDSQYDRRPYSKNIAFKIIADARQTLAEIENSLNERTD